MGWVRIRFMQELCRHPDLLRHSSNFIEDFTRYNGTVLAACRIFQEHPLSSFHRVKHNTRRTYLKDLRLIEVTVGARLISNVTILDVQR
jgi:hypothetical protein